MINTCRYPIRTETDRLLETYNTADNTVPRTVSSALACSVTKMPRPEAVIHSWWLPRAAR